MVEGVPNFLQILSPIVQGQTAEHLSKLFMREHFSAKVTTLDMVDHLPHVLQNLRAIFVSSNNICKPGQVLIGIGGRPGLLVGILKKLEDRLQNPGSIPSPPWPGISQTDVLPLPLSNLVQLACIYLHTYYTPELYYNTTFSASAQKSKVLRQKMGSKSITVTRVENFPTVELLQEIQIQLSFI